MSSIVPFASALFTDGRPRPDAEICIRDYNIALARNCQAYRPAKLLEFHPNHHPREKLRGYAFVAYDASWMSRGDVYPIQGKGFLEKPYIYVREFLIHRQDREALTEYCQRVLRGGSLILHSCPVPFPMFKRADRVVVIPYRDAVHDMERSGATRTNMIGQIGTVVGDSSPKGLTPVAFDDRACMRGFKYLWFLSIALRPFQESSSE